MSDSDDGVVSSVQVVGLPSTTSGAAFLDRFRAGGSESKRPRRSSRSIHIHNIEDQDMQPIFLKNKDDNSSVFLYIGNNRAFTYKRRDGGFKKPFQAKLELVEAVGLLPVSATLHCEHGSLAPTLRVDDEQPARTLPDKPRRDMFVTWLQHLVSGAADPAFFALIRRSIKRKEHTKWATPILLVRHCIAQHASAAVPAITNQALLMRAAKLGSLRQEELSMEDRTCQGCGKADMIDRFVLSGTCLRYNFQPYGEELSYTLFLHHACYEQLKLFHELSHFEAQTYRAAVKRKKESSFAKAKPEDALQVTQALMGDERWINIVQDKLHTLLEKVN